MKTLIFACRPAILFFGIACINCICIPGKIQKDPHTGIRISCDNTDEHENDKIAVAGSNYYFHWGTLSSNVFRSPVLLQTFKPYVNGDEFENTGSDLVAVNTFSKLS